MSNDSCNLCGGCIFRAMKKEEYRQKKEADFKHTVSLVKNATPVFDEPVFIDDGLRRRAVMSFNYKKHELKLGFNERESHNLVDIKECPMLTTNLNRLLPDLHNFLEEFSQIKITVKNKKKIEYKTICSGLLHLLEADNGIDMMLAIEDTPALNHRLLIADFVNSVEQINRFSLKVKQFLPETVVEKITPELHIADCVIAVPEAGFLQASKKAETEMIAKVLEYMDNTRGKIADLFCGLGTFTYPLAKMAGNEIISSDSYEPALEGLRKAINRNQLQNVTVINRNLFKYPFDKDDLKSVKAVVIDPPRAGAHEQCREIAQMEDHIKPEKIIFISCNPQTFVYDAQTLITAGYTFEKVTLIDQFVYSKHQELIALFTFNLNNHKGE